MSSFFPSGRRPGPRPGAAADPGRRGSWRGLAAAALAMCLAASPAGAVTFFAGNDAMDWCDGTGPGEVREDAAKLGACFAFLGASVGAASALDHWGYRHERAGRPDASCVPGGLTLSALREAWLAYGRANRDRLEYDASSVALNAFEEAWPCP